MRQPFATRVESVTPFLVKFWEGSLKFEPDVDVWIDVNRMELRDVLMEGSFLGVAESLGAEVTTHADGSRSGLSPVIWQSWETMGVDVSFDLGSSQSTETSTSNRQGTADEFASMFKGGGRAAQRQLDSRGGQAPGSFRVEEAVSYTHLRAHET